MLDKANPERNLTSSLEVTAARERPAVQNPYGVGKNVTPNNNDQVGKIAPGAIKRGTNGPPKIMKKAEFLSVQVEEEDKALIEKLAKRRGVSMSQVCRTLLRGALEPYRKKEKENNS